MTAEITPIRKLREKLRLTQAKVARDLGIDQAHLSRIEIDGKCSPTVAQSIVRYFGRRGLTELHVLYPERYRTNGKGRAA